MTVLYCLQNVTVIVTLEIGQLLLKYLSRNKTRVSYHSEEMWVFLSHL